MTEPKKYQLNRTRDLRVQNYYTEALENEFKKNAFSEERAPLNRGKWRSDVLHLPEEIPMDLEIGTGNGTHFRHHALKFPERGLVGIEMKYKPLIQTIRRTLKDGAKNAAVARYHAFGLADLFSENEIDNIYIHFPDPWTSPRKPRNRIVQKMNLDLFWKLQRPGSKIEFKTDSEEAFNWCVEDIKESPYKIEFLTHDLHASEIAATNFVTAFEKIFLRQDMKIHYVRLLRMEK
jgi:tRNA (guanine-N7-)-methyltransferase